MATAGTKEFIEAVERINLEFARAELPKMNSREEMIFSIGWNASKMADVATAEEIE